MKAANCLRNIALCGLVLWPLSGASGKRGDRVFMTKHNLSSYGPGVVKIAGQEEVCKFCHTPHVANPVAPLWNRPSPGRHYQTYESPTLVARVGQPTGSSRLCLSCHDGTIALTQTHNPRNAPLGTVFISAKDTGYIGTDLRDDHPISFVYDSSLATRKGNLRDPSTLPDQLVLDKNRQLQCTTCHDVHSNRFGKFLTMSNESSQMCRTCHTITGWDTSAHAKSGASLHGARGRWDNIEAGTVRQAACEACHRPHTAGGRYWLMRHEAEEDNCLACHNGSVASKNMVSEFKKFSRHPVSLTTGVHDPTEKPSSMATHVECGDCHNPHMVASGTKAQAPFIKSTMKGATGVAGTRGGTAVATYEYQVCYKCHSLGRVVRSPLVDRVIVNTDVAEEFDASNPSYHPVETRGRNSNVPSLLNPYTTSSMIYCTDCHSSSSSVKGPHGSVYRPLLVRRYVTTDTTSETPTAYALCYGCHDRASILANRSFPEHKRHITTARTPCAICHDPHGVSGSQGTSTSATHLINFDRRAVLQSTAAKTGPSFTDLGSQRGSCTLLCHKRDHNNQTYQR